MNTQTVEAVATITFNKQLNGIEISYTQKPAPEVLAELKEDKFYWHRRKKVWYIKDTPDNRLTAQKYGVVPQG